MDFLWHAVWVSALYRLHRAFIPLLPSSKSRPTHDVPTPKELLANVHKLRDAPASIARKLVQLERDEPNRLGAVEG